MLKSQTPTLEQIKEALEKNNGAVVSAAHSLGIGKTWLYRKINNSKVLQDHLAEIRNDIVDLAECKLREKIEAGDITAIIYTLRSMGKRRGWSQNAGDW